MYSGKIRFTVLEEVWVHTISWHSSTDTASGTVEIFAVFTSVKYGIWVDVVCFHFWHWYAVDFQLTTFWCCYQIGCGRSFVTGVFCSGLDISIVWSCASHKSAVGLHKLLPWSFSMSCWLVVCWLMKRNNYCKSCACVPCRSFLFLELVSQSRDNQPSSRSSLND